MIRINLLPPELRKHAASFNPLVLAGVAEAILCILLLAFGAYLQWVKLPAAQVILDKEIQTKTEKQAKADQVASDEAKIQDFQSRLDELHDLLGRKVYWAHTLDDFTTLLASNFPGGLTVRCLELSVEPSTGASADRRSSADRLVYAFRGKFQLVGDPEGPANTTGDFEFAMFRQIAASAFWRQHGFQGKPDDTYWGDKPLVNKEINKLVIPLNLEFQRVHLIPGKAGG